MDLADGLPVEQPAVVIPWHIREAELRELVGEAALTHVTRGYFTTTCTLLGGLRLSVGFHFTPRTQGRLREFELFRQFQTPLRGSYAEFQRHLESALGLPTHTENRESDYPSHEWRTSGVSVVHYVLDRFGPEEHVRFRK